MYRHSYEKRVRYGETDQMGFLYYGNYPLLYEIGRVEAIRALGVSYKDLETKYNIMMPVLSVESRYLKPAYYDELIRIDTILSEMPSKMVNFDFEIFNPSNECIHKACVKLFFVNMITNKRVSMPQILTDKLLPYFE